MNHKEALDRFPRVSPKLHAVIMLTVLLGLGISVYVLVNSNLRNAILIAAGSIFLLFAQIVYLLVRVTLRVALIEEQLKDFYSPAINDVRRDFRETSSIILKYLPKLINGDFAKK
jgi:hypothetical protein